MERENVWTCMCVCVTFEEVKITALGNLDINLPCHSYWHQLSLLELGIILFYLTQVSCPAQDGGHRKHSKHVLGRSREVKEGREGERCPLPSFLDISSHCFSIKRATAGLR